MSQNSDQAPERFTWTVAITVDKIWVEDGFNLTPERLKDMVQSDLDFATEDEIEVAILSATSPAAIRLIQGYPRPETVYCAEHGEVIPFDDHGIERCPKCEKATSYSMREAREYEAQDEPEGKP
jgi:hypothetical protein